MGLKGSKSAHETSRLTQFGKRVRASADEIIEPPRKPPRGEAIFEVVFLGPGRGNALDNIAVLSRFIRSARKSLDIAIFNFTANQLAEAVLERHNARIKVRIIADHSQVDTSTSVVSRLRRAGIPVRLNRGKYLMHNKFAVVDGTACVNGSYNWTTGAAMHYQENFVISRYAKLAACFSSEFNRMWQAFAPAGAGCTAMAPIGYKTGECLALFFPEHSDGNLDLLIREIGTASKTVDVCVYVITHPRLTELLVNVQRRGVQVRVITDFQQAKVHNRRHIDALRSGGIEVRTNKPPHNMHDKFCIVDGRKLCSGSFNWTQQADKYNNENCVVFNDEQLAKRFSVEFVKLWVTFATNRKRQRS